VKRRGVVLSQFIPRYVFCAPFVVSVFAVTFATDCLRRYVRVHLLSYHAFHSLDHWDVDHRELGYLYYRNLSSFSSQHLVLTSS
jgi:hypothetical protein